MDWMMQQLSAMTGVTEDDVLSAALDRAAQEVIKARDPFGVAGITEVEDRYLYDQLAVAEYLIDKRGAAGETAHGENGVNRTYESAGVPRSLLRNIVPIGKVLGGA